MESEKLNMIEQVSAIEAWHKDDIKSTNIGVLSLSIRSRWRYLFEFDMEVELSICSKSFITLIAMLGVRGTPGGHTMLHCQVNYSYPHDGMELLAFVSFQAIT